MTQKFPWFRLYSSDLLGDRKIKRIAKQTNIDKATVIGVWITILSLANDSPERGKLLIDGGSPLEYEEIVCECGVDVLRFDAILRQFLSEDYDMLAIDTETQAYMVVQWNERQPISDTTGAERVRKHRERQKMKRYSNALEEEGEEEEESEGDTATGNIFTFYKNNIEMLTPYNVEKLKSLMEDYPEDWILEAMQIAVEYNKRNIAYFSAILKRWKAEGKNTVQQQTEKSFDELAAEQGYR